MGVLSPRLANIYQRRVLNPVIIEFVDEPSMQALLPTLKKFVDVTKLTSVGPPATVLRPQDRFRSRFQNTILALKVLSRFKMVAMPLDPRSIDQVVAWPEVVKIYPDTLRYALSIVPPEGVYTSPIGKDFTTLSWTRKLIGADIANQEGYSGKGIVSAVLDTGGSPAHQITRGMEYYSTMRDKGQFKDHNGHGQWVTSCVGGIRVFDRTLNVELEGMAPETTLVSVMVLGFVLGVGFDSDILEGIQLAIERRADIVNMSLGSDEQPTTPDDDPLIKGVDELDRNNIIPVVAAGNAGPGVGTVGTPGCAATALTVGAYNPITGTIPDVYSSRGPSILGGVKPDFVMPGSDIYAGALGVLDPVGDGLTNNYAILSGTSMACPHMAGLLACARQFYKEKYGVILTAGMVKDIGTRLGTAKNNDTGFGVLDWTMIKTYAQSYLV